jgi:hypothetical protein
MKHASSPRHIAWHDCRRINIHAGHAGAQVTRLSAPVIAAAAAAAAAAHLLGAWLMVVHILHLEGTAALPFICTRTQQANHISHMRLQATAYGAGLGGELTWHQPGM